MNLRNLPRICLLLGFVLSANSAFADDKPVVTPKTRQHFQAGLAHFDDPSGPKYEEAYREFQIAYAETPSYSIAGNIGTCAFYLERDSEAIEMYELFLAKATPEDISKKKREQMHKDIQSLRAGLVHLSIRTTPTTGTLIDERFTTKGTTVVNRYPVSNGVAALGIHPGNHKVTLEAEGYESQTWAFDAPPASSQAHEFTLTAVVAKKASDAANPAAPPSNGSSKVSDSSAPKRTSPWVYVGVAATGAFALGAVGMGLVARSKNSDYDAANDGAQIEKASGLRDDTKRFLLISDVLTGAAVLSVGATLYFYLSSPSNPKPATATRSSWQVAPTLGAAHGGVAVSGNF